jgi:hypothetical protein
MANAHALRNDAHALTQLALALVDHPASERFARAARELFAQADKAEAGVAGASHPAPGDESKSG